MVVLTVGIIRRWAGDGESTAEGLPCMLNNNVFCKGLSCGLTASENLFLDLFGLYFGRLINSHCNLFGDCTDVH